MQKRNLFKGFFVKIGDRVTNHKLGPIWIGEVVAIVSSHYPHFLSCSFGGATWDETYPEWKAHDLVVVRLDQSARNCTLEEAVTQGLSRRAWEDIPMMKFATNTILDLVNLSEDEATVEEAVTQ